MGSEIDDTCEAVHSSALYIPHHLHCVESTFQNPPVSTFCFPVFFAALCSRLNSVAVVPSWMPTKRNTARLTCYVVLGLVVIACVYLAVDSQSSPSLVGGDEVPPPHEIQPRRLLSPQQEPPGLAVATSELISSSIETPPPSLIVNLSTRWFMDEDTATNATLSRPLQLGQTLESQGHNFIFDLRSERTHFLGRTRKGDAIFSRFVFEMYGDSTLREIWETMVKIMVWSADSTMFKRKANTTERGPFYTSHMFVDHKKQPRPRRGELCPAMQRVSFRFDYRDSDLIDPAALTSNDSAIPPWFLAHPDPSPLMFDAAGKARHDWTTNRNCEEGKQKAPSNASISWRCGPKILMFSIGAHFAVRYRNLTTVDLKAKLTPLITQYLQFLDSRKEVAMVVLLVAKYNCGQIMDWKFQRRVKPILRQLNCRRLNGHVKTITDLVKHIVKNGNNGSDGGPVVSPSFTDRFHVLEAIEYPAVPQVKERYCTHKFCRKYHPTSDGLHLMEQWKWLRTNALMHLIWTVLDGDQGADPRRCMKV